MSDQPGPGGKVRDKHGKVWTRTGDTGGSDWELDEAAGFEPESWGRVCEFGPLSVIDEAVPLRSLLYGDCTMDSDGTIRDEAGRVVCSDGVLDGTAGLRGDMSGLYGKPADPP